MIFENNLDFFLWSFFRSGIFFWGHLSPPPPPLTCHSPSPPPLFFPLGVTVFNIPFHSLSSPPSLAYSLSSPACLTSHLFPLSFSTPSPHSFSLSVNLLLIFSLSFTLPSFSSSPFFFLLIMVLHLHFQIFIRRLLRFPFLTPPSFPSSSSFSTCAAPSLWGTRKGRGNNTHPPWMSHAKQSPPWVYGPFQTWPSPVS